MKPLGQTQLDHINAAKCQIPGCDCGAGESKYMRARCHMEARGTLLCPRPHNLLELLCPTCRRVIVEIKVEADDLPTVAKPKCHPESILQTRYDDLTKQLVMECLECEKEQFRVAVRP